MMRLPVIAFFNLLALLATLTVNALANILPINGYNTGQVSAFYPNYFVPAGFTFGIWSVIYLWLLVFAGRSLQLAFSAEAGSAPGSLLRRISPLFWLTCLFNCTWILAWHHLMPGLSLLIMLALLATLLRLFLMLAASPQAPAGKDYWLMAIPMIIYFAWICVATIANTTALLVQWQWSGWGIAAPVWSAIMIGVACLLACWVMLRFGQIPFVMVVLWALWGIYKGQSERSALVGNVALAAMACCLLALLTGFWRRPSPAQPKS